MRLMGFQLVNIFQHSRAGLSMGRSRPMMSMTPAIPASGLRISCASPAASSPRVARCSARDICVRCRRWISSRLSRNCDHGVEIATQIADLIVASRELNHGVQVPEANHSNLLLQLQHRAPEHDCHYHKHNRADDHRASGGDNQNGRHPLSIESVISTKISSPLSRTKATGNRTITLQFILTRLTIYTIPLDVEFTIFRLFARRRRMARRTGQKICPVSRLHGKKTPASAGSIRGFLEVRRLPSKSVRGVPAQDTGDLAANTAVQQRSLG